MATDRLRHWDLEPRATPPRPIRRVRRLSFPPSFANGYPLQGGHVVVVMRGVRAIAYAWLVKLGPGLVDLAELAVLPNDRGRGLSRGLIFQAAIWADQRGFVEMAAAPLVGEAEKDRRAWLGALGFTEYRASLRARCRDLIDINRVPAATRSIP